MRFWATRPFGAGGGGTARGGAATDTPSPARRQRRLRARRLQDGGLEGRHRRDRLGILDRRRGDALFSCGLRREEGLAAGEQCESDDLLHFCCAWGTEYCERWLRDAVTGSDVIAMRVGCAMLFPMCAQPTRSIERAGRREV